MREGAVLEFALFVAAGVLFVAGYGIAERNTPFELEARVAGILRVATWNVGGTGGSWGRPLDDEHVEHVARTLSELDPDLVFLQEVQDAAQAFRLRDQLGAGWSLEVASAGRGRRVAALARRGTLERLPQGASASGALFVRYAGDDGQSLVALGLHADASSAARRNAEIGAAADLLFASEANGRVLLGDLNLDLDLGKRRDLFTDDEHGDVSTYNYVALRLVDAARDGGATAEPDRRLDYVFVEHAAFAVRSAGPLHDRRVGDMDHDPVVADLAPRR